MVSIGTTRTTMGACEEDEMEIGVVSEKMCYRCREVKSLAEFWKDIREKDGHRRACIVCVKKSVNKEKKAAWSKDYMKRYYAENGDKMRVRSRKWYADNKARAEEARRARRENAS